jgi:hypothetical protein
MSLNSITAISNEIEEEIPMSWKAVAEIWYQDSITVLCVVGTGINMLYQYSVYMTSIEPERLQLTC